MPANEGWTRQELLVAFGIYCQMPFGKLHSRNPEIIKYAAQIGRTPSALAMKLTNIASLDPAITSTGRKGLSGASFADRKMWEDMENDWESFAQASEIAIGGILQGDQSLATIESEGVDGEDYVGLDKEIKAKARLGQSFSAVRCSVLTTINAV